MATQSESWISLEQYLDLERESEGKHEYCAGHIEAMAGATLRHVEIADQLNRAVFPRAREAGCRTFGNDLMVVVDATGLHTYPDLTVVCGTLQVRRERGIDVVSNPSILFEVLSPSTERYDRGEKFAHYRQIPSLQTYVMISQEKPLVEVYTREPDNSWRLRVYAGIEAVAELAPLGLHIPLREIYDGLLEEDGSA